MLFDESDPSLNSNDNSFLTNSSDAPSSSNGPKAVKCRNVVNHFYMPEKPRTRPKRAESVKDVLEELISQKTDNSLKLTNRNNSNIKSVHFTSPLAMQHQQPGSLSQSPQKLPSTPKPTETYFLKPSIAKAKYAHTPLVKADVVRTSSLRYANPSSLKLYFSNQNSTTGRFDESKSLENLKDHEQTGSPNTHSINRLVKMASSWSIKSRASSTSSNYVDPNLVSQLKIRQTHMFLSDENDYATIDACLSRQLGRTGLVDQTENKWTTGGVIRRKKFQPIVTSSKRSSVVDDADLVLPRMEPRFNSQKMNFAKQRLTRSFRLVNLNRNLCADKKPILINDNRILNKDKNLPIPIK